MRILITDLDNTLWDWVTYFGRAFEAMASAVVALLDVPRDALLAEYRAMHRELGSSEQPFTTLALPIVEARLPGLSPAARAERLEPAFAAFERAREQHLRLYPGVAETLRECAERGVVVVGHTESIAVNACFRLCRLGIDGSFRRLYTLEGNQISHPDPRRAAELAPPPGFIVEVPRAERKPNPRLLLDICRREGFEPSDAIYVGDSLTRDIAMARDAGVLAVWARYGTRYERDAWESLVRVTHWTAGDVAREERLQAHAHEVTPDLAIEAYDEVRRLLRAGR